MKRYKVSESTKMSQNITERDLDRHYNNQLIELKKTCASAKYKMDVIICDKWLKIFENAPQDQKYARSCLILLMRSQLDEVGELGLPFLDMRNCYKDLEVVLNSYHGVMYPTSVVQNNNETKKSINKQQNNVQLNVEYMENAAKAEYEEIWTPNCFETYIPKRLTGGNEYHEISATSKRNDKIQHLPNKNNNTQNTGMMLCPYKENNGIAHCSYKSRLPKQEELGATAYDDVASTSSSSCDSKLSLNCKICNIRSDHALYQQYYAAERQKCDKCYKPITENLEKLHREIFHTKQILPTETTNTTTTTDDDDEDYDEIQRNTTTKSSSADFLKIAKELLQKNAEVQKQLENLDKKFDQLLVHSFEHYYEYRLKDIQRGFRQTYSKFNQQRAENCRKQLQETVLKKLSYMVIFKMIMMEEFTPKIDNAERFVQNLEYNIYHLSNTL